MDNLTAEQLQQLSNLALMQTGLQHQASMYRPQFSMPDIMAAGTGSFSFGQRLGQTFGQGGAQLGMLADVALPMFMGPQYTSFVQRLNLAGGNADLLAQQGARRYQALVGQMGVGDVGNLISRELGLAGTEYDKYVQSFSPVVDMMTGGMVSDVARMINPSLITQQGAMSIVTAQRRLDTMGRLDENRAMALKAQMQDRISLGAVNGQTMTRQEAVRRGFGRDVDRFGFRDDFFTGGFNADDFAEIIAVAADAGIRDFAYANNIGADVISAQADAEFARRKAANPSLQSTPELMARIRSEMRDNQALIGGASNTAQIMQSMRGAFGQNLSAGELGNMMVSMGFTPGSAADVEGIRQTIEQLRSLGEAAGLSADQMRNAGQALQQQFGGSQAYNMSVAGMMGVTNRLYRDASIREGRGFTDFDTTQELTSRFAEQNLVAQSSRFKLMAAAVNQDPTRREELRRIMREQGPEAAADYIYDLSLRNGGMVRRAEGLSQSMADAAWREIEAYSEGSDQLPFLTRGIQRGLMGRVRGMGRVTVDMGGGATEVNTDFFTRLGELSDQELDLFAMAMNAPSLASFTEEQVGRLQNMADRIGGGQDIRALLAAARTGTRAGSANQAIADLVTSFVSQSGLRRAKPAMQDQTRRREIARILAMNSRGQEGMTSLLDLFTEGDVLSELGSVDGIMNQLERAGLLTSENKQALLTRLQGDEEVSDEMINAFQALGNAWKADNTRSTPDSKAKLKEAQDRLTSLYGIGQKVDMRLPGTQALQAVNAAKEMIGKGVDFVKGLFGGGEKVETNKGRAGANADGDPGTGGTASEDTKTTKVRLDVELRASDGLVVSANQAQSANNGIDVRILGGQSASREMTP